MSDRTQEAPLQIKAVTKKVSLRNGKISVVFHVSQDYEPIQNLYLKQRNSIEPLAFPFQLTASPKKDHTEYKAVLDVKSCKMELGFWGIVADVGTDKENVQEMILGGVGSRLKIQLVLFPQWTKIDKEHMVYLFINGARQFSIQYRKYDSKYDSWLFIFKEYLALFCYFILKPYWDRKKIWLVCEKFCTMAQDNGLYFFRYCMENLEPEEKKKVLYVIDKNVSEYEAVSMYPDNVIQFMSFRYMIYLCAAEFLISTDAIRHFYIWDSPNSVFKVLYQVRKNLVFLQHGVMGLKQCHKTYRKSGSNRMALFVVSSEYEKDIIENYFEYDREEIIVTGLPRWDVLENKAGTEQKEILLMPTWRSWLDGVSEEEFKKSAYYKHYEALLTNQELYKMLEEENVTFNFYIHPKFRDYMGQFSSGNERIRMIAFGQQPLNELLMSCNLLVTDYSSVSWDVYYQEKPVLFYPFDVETYMERQGSYMDYETDLFGDVVKTPEELLEAIKSCIASGWKEKECYKARRDYLLPYRDDKNSERVYQYIKNFKSVSKWKTFCMRKLKRK